MNRIAPISFLAIALLLLSPKARAEDSVGYKFQYYQERSDRILVRAHYARAEKDLGPDTTLTVVGLIDAISGASPTGAPAPAGSTQVPLAKLEDVRRAFTVDLARQWGRHRIVVQVSRSKEDDYLSRGLSLSTVSEFNQKNTAVRLGASFTDDDIFPSFLLNKEAKRGADFIVGVTQTISPATLFTANLSYGRAKGYLNDPYKAIQKTLQLTPTISRAFLFVENRPGERKNWIGYTALTHFFEPLNASGEVTYRFFDDEFGGDANTLSLEWFQKLNAHWMLRPSFRFHTQRAASFYYPTLDRTSITPAGAPTRAAPYYSADYRLSALRSVTYGLKAVYTPRDWLSVDLAYENYKMSGRDGVTSASAYPEARIVTVGMKLWY